MKKDLVMRLLSGVEGASEIAQTIFDAHGASIDSLKAKHDVEIEKLNTKLETSENARLEAEETLQTALGDETSDQEIKDLKTKLKVAEQALKAEQDEHEATKTTYEAKEHESTAYKAVYNELEKAKYPKPFLDDFIKANVDLTKLTRDEDGKINNLDTYVKSILEDPSVSSKLTETRTEHTAITKTPISSTPPATGGMNAFIRGSVGKANEAEDGTGTD